MSLEEVFVHDYLMHGILLNTPLDELNNYLPLYKKIDEHLNLDGENEDLSFPKTKVHYFSEKEAFNKKEHFMILPGIIFISDYERDSSTD